MKKTADDNSYAKISQDSVEIFGQVFPLKNTRFPPTYYKTGELKSFDIPDTVIDFMGKRIPIGGIMRLYEDGKFHGTVIDKIYTYEHKGQLFKIGGGIYFYKSGNLESFYLKETAETDFIVDGKKLVFFEGQQVFFHEESGLPKTIKFVRTKVFQGKEFNVIELSETGEITDRIMGPPRGYDYD
jgi:hypothetical protein